LRFGSSIAASSAKAKPSSLASISTFSRALCLLPHLEGGNCLGDGLLQIPQIGERQDREVEIRHQLLRFIQYNSVHRARIALQESSGAGGLRRRSYTFSPPGRFYLGQTLPDEVG
jgi:hypothetical protein